MMLKDIINEDMKSYMRSKATFALEAVRMLKAEIKNAEINTMKTFEDADVVRTVQSIIKKNKEAIEIYVKNNRQDLADKEQQYIDALKKYVPEQLGDGELLEIIKAAIAELGGTDPKNSFSELMKKVLAKVDGRADGKTVSTKLKELLG
ncbi:GatB/YqeY domain-containing protein [Deferribacterales bacterium RsTz2092]|nr:aspartyl-tRNA amidotransferase subunit B [Deferribacterales bacterium]